MNLHKRIQELKASGNDIETIFEILNKEDKNTRYTMVPFYYQQPYIEAEGVGGRGQLASEIGENNKIIEAFKADKASGYEGLEAKMFSVSTRLVGSLVKRPDEVFDNMQAEDVVNLLSKMNFSLSGINETRRLEANKSTANISLATFVDIADE